jgi:WD40 repeat protein
MFKCIAGHHNSHLMLAHASHHLSPHAFLMLVFLMIQKGHLQVELYSKGTKSTIPAHETELAAIGISFDGTRVATASEKGTLIRVFDTETGQQLHELRRGIDKATIYCLAFDRSCSYIALTSDKGTCHIYLLSDASRSSEEIGVEGGEGPVDSSKASEVVVETSAPSEGTLGFLKGMIPKYFSSVTSTAQIRGIEGKAICAFTNEPNTLAVICADGNVYTANFSKGGDCEKTSYRKFMWGKDADLMDKKDTI